jgi:hypothetical protein
MDSDAKIFFYFTTTFGALLRSTPRIDFTEKLPTLPAHILDDGSKLTERSIKHMFSKHSFGTGAVI